MEALSVLILPATCILIFDLLQCGKRDFTENLTRTILTYEVLILLMANLLSVGSHLNRNCVFLFWFACGLVTVAIGFLRYGKAYPAGAGRLGKMITGLPGEFRKLSLLEKGMFLSGGVLVLVLLVGALFTVPYNYDSMTYHLARIGYWIDHGNVNYYVTNIDRQLFSPVLAEYNLLPVMLLTGSDILLNLQQFLFMLLAAYYIFKIAEMIGTKRIFAVFASFAYLTMPLTITQAVTTQNDLSAGLFFLLFLYELLWFVQKDRLTENLLPLGRREKGTGIGKKEHKSNALFAEKCIRTGMCVGFAFLMKVSVCASLVMFMPWLLVVCVRRRDRLVSLLQAGMLAGAAMLVTVSETLIRTYQACGSLIAETTSGDIMVATKNVSYIIVNILKNYSLLITQHFWTWLNGFVYRIAIRVGALLHVEVNNIAISYHGFDFITYLNTGDDMYSHDRTSSAFVSYLALAAGVMLVIAIVRLVYAEIMRKAEKIGKSGKVGKSRKQNTNALPFLGRKVSVGFVISAWLSFGFIMALLRWQPWGSRLMYPALTVTVIASAHMLDVFCEKLKKKEIVLLPLALLSILLCISPLQYNMQEAVHYLEDGCKNRIAHYFVHNDRSDAYEELMEEARRIGAKDVAVVISGDGYDYPLWKMFHDSYPEATLRHILVDDSRMAAVQTTLKGANIDGRNAKGPAKTMDAPDCILWVERGLLETSQKLDYFGKTYECVFVSDSEKAPDALLVPCETVEDEEE